MCPKKAVYLAPGGLAFEPRDDATSHDQDERGELPDSEAPDDVEPTVAVHFHDPEPRLLGDLHPGDEAFHPARRPRAARADEEQDR